METISVTISFVAGALQLLGYWFYNRGIFRGEIKPNASSWFLWSIGSLIATISYGSVSEDWVKNILPITCSVACICTLLLSLWIGNFSRPDKWDVLVIFLDVIVVVFWMTTEMEKLANLFLQFDIILSFWPMVRETYKNPKNERLTPWLIWNMAYMAMLVVVLMRFESFWDLIYPINLLGLCLIVSFLISRNTATCE